MFNCFDHCDVNEQDPLFNEDNCLWWNTICAIRLFLFQQFELNQYKSNEIMKKKTNWGLEKGANLNEPYFLITGRMLLLQIITEK